MIHDFHREPNVLKSTDTTLCNVLGQANFQKLCVALLEKEKQGGQTHEEKINELRRLFPKAKQWLDWWTISDVESMLFPSRRPLLEDTGDANNGLPDTTNAQESMHRLYYMMRLVQYLLLCCLIKHLAYWSPPSNQ
jgi:hypothetical protein